jgi:multidrug efflux system membrane fusion protein
MRRFAILPPLVLAAFLLAPLALTSAEGAEFTVEKAAIEDLKAVFATVESTHRVPARARIGGTLAGLSVVEGDKVQAGDRLANVGDVKIAYEGQAQEARIASAQASRDQARLDLDRAVELKKSGVGTQARADDARTRLEIADKALAAARAERQVMTQRSNEGAVLAPASGRVLKVHVTNGSVLLPGEAVADIAIENYLLRLRLPERHARFLKMGTKVRVAERGQIAGGEALREGEVVRVYPEIDQGRVTADVKVEGLGDYFVGERARVYIPTGTREGVRVPPDYLIRRFGLTYARLKDGLEIVVQPGRADGQGVEILTGLKAGDVLVKP